VLSDSDKLSITDGQRFFNSNTFSDITIISGGQSFHAHKVVLSAQSDYFATLCSGSWNVRKAI
jgi:hypothetical protein